MPATSEMILTQKRLKLFKDFLTRACFALMVLHHRLNQFESRYIHDDLDEKRRQLTVALRDVRGLLRRFNATVCLDDIIMGADADTARGQALEVLGALLHYDVVIRTPEQSLLSVKERKHLRNAQSLLQNTRSF